MLLGRVIDTQLFSGMLAFTLLERGEKRASHLSEQMQPDLQGRRTELEPGLVTKHGSMVVS